ncbi:MAG: TonB C-terminal domain-containing protein [Acidobacteriaceae bacterium]|nr:TonB C-terminal domain-containing protein [Acidobacteriaceae bacterium]
MSGFTGDDGETFTRIVLPAVLAQTKKSWYPLIPTSAQPPQSEQRRVGIRFELHSDGKIRKMVLESPSGDLAFDRAAWGALCSSFGAFPPQMKTEFVQLRFLFLYNITMNPPSPSGKRQLSAPNPVN